MKKHKFTCPSCSKTYEIKTYNTGTNDVMELFCDYCGATLNLDLYDRRVLELDKKYREYSKEYFAEIESILNPCECGGRFRFDAPPRCKFCRAVVDLEEIKRQINWWGSKDGRPGLIMSRSAPASKAWRKIAKRDKSA